MSPWLIHTCKAPSPSWGVSSMQPELHRRTFFRIFPRIWANRFSPSKHWASNLPFPNIFVTWAYSCPSSRNTSSRLSSSFSFFPRLRFFPPCMHTSKRSIQEPMVCDRLHLSFILSNQSNRSQNSTEIVHVRSYLWHAVLKSF
jgi:hypothetical protein